MNNDVINELDERQHLNPFLLGTIGLPFPFRFRVKASESTPTTSTSPCRLAA